MAHVTRPTAHFSPHGGCEEAAIEVIAAARSSIRLAAYSFTSGPIFGALALAHNRGVDVKAIVDARMANERGGKAHDLKVAGVEVMADASHPIFHSKYIVADSAVVVAGSYNWSNQARSNAENMPVYPDPEFAAAYLADWDRHRAHAIALPAPTVGAEMPWVEVGGSLVNGWRVHVDGVSVGPTVADYRDLEPVARWLRAALGDLAGELGVGDAEGDDSP